MVVSTNQGLSVSESSASIQLPAYQKRDEPWSKPSKEDRRGSCRILIQGLLVCKREFPKSRGPKMEL